MGAGSCGLLRATCCAHTPVLIPVAAWSGGSLSHHNLNIHSASNQLVQGKAFIAISGPQFPLAYSATGNEA